MLGIGTDLVDINRFRAVLTRTPRIVERLFRPEEQEYANQATDPIIRLAARFAAKEATLKALGRGLGGANLVDIEVVKHEDGRPELRLHDTAAVAAEEVGARRFLLTISHTDSIAHAIVVAFTS